MSPRQRALYKALLANVSVADLLEKAANIGDVDSARSLMNLVMQFRKVSYSLLLSFEGKQLTLETPRFAITQNFLNVPMLSLLFHSAILENRAH